MAAALMARAAGAIWARAVVPTVDCGVAGILAEARAAGSEAGVREDASAAALALQRWR